MRKDKGEKLIINIEGIDGTGKNTISKRLAEIFTKQGEKVLITDFPNYDLPSGRVIKRFLAGELLGDPIKTDPVTASMLYAVDRRHNFDLLRNEIEESSVILSDRSYLSNFFFQASKYALNEENKITKESIKANEDRLFAFIELMRALEVYTTYLNYHKEDTVNLLLYHPDIRTNYELMKGRENSKDMYENDFSYLKNVSEFSLEFSQTCDVERMLDYPEYNYELIPCSGYGDTTPFKIDDICNHIIDVVSTKLYL